MVQIKFTIKWLNENKAAYDVYDSKVIWSFLEGLQMSDAIWTNWNRTTLASRLMPPKMTLQSIIAQSVIAHLQH